MKPFETPISELECAINPALGKTIFKGNESEQAMKGETDNVQYNH